MKTSHPDAVVIGAGIIGLSTALGLADVGLRVCVLNDTADARGASWAGGGILSPLPPDSTPEGLQPLLQRSLDAYPNWCRQLHESTGIDPEYWACGADYCDASGRLIRYPQLAQVRNPRLIKALRARLGQLGVSIEAQARVIRLEWQAHRVTAVRLAERVIPCGLVIVCAGAWSGAIAQVPVTPVKGQMLLLRGRPGQLPRIIIGQDAYVIPRKDGRILVGSTLEDAGYDTRPTIEARHWLLQQLADLAPGLETLPIEDHWAGLRPRPAGDLPFIGPDPIKQGLYFNTGHYRLGITLAPASAEAMVRLVTTYAQESGQE